MRRRAIANFCAIPSALFLLLIGIHRVVNVLVGRRAIARGEIAARLRDSVVVNAAFAGLALSLLGVLILLPMPALRAGSRTAARVAAAVGLFVGVLGAAGSLWAPTKPSVLIFLFFGVVLAAPLLVWRGEFPNP
jgi:hypothetical protein